ncbi:GHKL domain-containing protein [Pilibacter termitis]|uniref:GHKL domain-containing protein n=1 Tax=Pilibacter termitis TaxID=263852 RepID=A0A1T4MHT9_9ENTE|nr:GHKL domain-containing protein [Pilibacter termitis]SJZ66437.1 GHKL domain-containing protein [Pilibacter termitis]
MNVFSPPLATAHPQGNVFEILSACLDYLSTNFSDLFTNDILPYTIEIILTVYLFHTKKRNGKLSSHYILSLLGLVLGYTLMLCLICIYPLLSKGDSINLRLINIVVYTLATILSVWYIGNKEKMNFRITVIYIPILLWLFLVLKDLTFFVINQIQVRFLFNTSEEPAHIFNNNLFAYFVTNLFFLICSAFAIWCLKKKLPFSPKDTEMNTPLLLAFLSVPIFSLLLYLFFIQGNILDSSGMNISKRGLLAILAIFFLNFCVLFLYKTMRNYYNDLITTTIQNKDFNAELKHYQQMEKTQNHLRRTKHDLKNQYILLSALLEKGEITEAQEILQHSLSDVEKTDNFYTNNFAMNYLLNEKNKIAIANNIKLNIKVLLPEKLKISNEYLAIVIGNLLDNSIAAVKRNKQGKNREITFTIKAFNHNVLIETSNTFDTSELETRKQRKYEGVGIKSIQKVIKERNGLYEQWIYDDVYATSIAFLNVY